MIIMVLVLLSAAWLTRRNLQQKKSDLTGALRLAAFVFVSSIVEHFLIAHHVPTDQEYDLFVQIIARSLLYGGITLIFYLALEPYVRRRWPDTLVGLQRILNSGWRDPLVGRDILVGLVWGLGVQSLSTALLFLSIKSGSIATSYVNLDHMLSLRNAAGKIVGDLSLFASFSAGIFFTAFMMCVIFRRDWIAGGILILLAMGDTLFSPQPLYVSIPTFTLFGLVNFVVARRYGLLALFLFNFSLSVVDLTPLTTSFSAWYAGNAWFVAATLLALGIYAFRTALGGQKVFTGKLLEE